MRYRINVRIGLLVFLALSVSLPIAFVSLAKVLLFGAGLYYLLVKRTDITLNVSQCGLATVPVILVCIAVWAVNLWLTGADQNQALIAFVKHGKLLTIPLLIYVVRTRQEARYGIMALILGQTLVLASSWLMALDIPLPWVLRPSGHGNILTEFVPYADSYLDQSIMLAATASLLWHLSHDETARWNRWLAAAALLNVLLLMPGRTGYVSAIVAIGLIAVFEIPRRWRGYAAIFIPVGLTLALFYSAPQFQQRVGLAAQELSAYEKAPDNQTSVGMRLNMWKLSLDAIRIRPSFGYGIGNWTPTIKRLQGPDADVLFGSGNGSNPHQELLLWSVELGAVGALLFVALFIALVHDTKRFGQRQQRACLSMVVMLAIACMFNSPLYDDLLGDYFCVALGLLMALGLRDNHELAQCTTLA